MKHKHSPHFFENLDEADTATNNRFSTFVWTVVFIGMLLFGFSITSCQEPKKQTGFDVFMMVQEEFNKSHDGFIRAFNNLNNDSMTYYLGRNAACIAIQEKINIHD